MGKTRRRPARPALTTGEGIASPPLPKSADEQAEEEKAETVPKPANRMMAPRQIRKR